MKQFALLLLALTGVVTLGFIGHAAPVITPGKHDFGKVAVGAHAEAMFRIRGTVPTPASSAWNPDSGLKVALRGPEADHFRVERGRASVDDLGDILAMVAATDKYFYFCARSPQAFTCDQKVFFAPKSPGPHSATLVISDPDGVVATAALSGVGSANCVMKVVHCNYALLYSGTFEWSTVLNGPASQHTQTVRVTVVDGLAACSGTETSTFQGNRRTGTISGPGLFAVEFEPDPQFKLAYRITGACPSAAWPPNPAEGDPGTPSQRAELGHNDQNSQKQPATEVAQKVLDGQITYPAPEVDPLNGVTGNVSIAWSLKQR